MGLIRQTKYDCGSIKQNSSPYTVCMQIEHPISASNAHSKLSLEFRLNSYFWFTFPYIFASHITNKERRSFEKTRMMPYVPDHTAEKCFSFCRSGTFVQLKRIFKMKKTRIFENRQVGYSMKGKSFFKKALS